MLCGQIGKPSSGVNPLRGQNNVQGGCDMGAMPHFLPGYQKWSAPEVRQRYEAAWGQSLPQEMGGRITDFIEAAGEGRLHGFYVMGEDPVVSEPNQDRVIAALRRLDFLVCQEIFLSETAKMADVVLPAAAFAEKDGTFTNTERRVQRIRKALEPPGAARADWAIICAVSAAMGHPMEYAHPGEIFDEMAALTPSYAGISYARIEETGLCWPCPTPDHPGTPYLHKDHFVHGKGRFHSISCRPPAEEEDESYPLILSTGRTLYHYNVGNMSRKSAVCRQKQPRCFVEINTREARVLGLADGDPVRVVTRRGNLVVESRVGDRVRPGMIWMPFHFAEVPTNRLTIDAFDPVTRTGEYKVCAARLERT
jgi:predicted molibdopterin-dependent oxidoreductase YjgC